jgi:hypothetical protein
MGPEHLFTSGTILDLGNNGRAAEAIWGAHVIGGIQVVPDRSLWGWNWQSFTCYNESNARLSSVSKYKKLSTLSQGSHLKIDQPKLNAFFLKNDFGLKWYFFSYLYLI